jgi:hypothetical protein
LRWDWLLRWGCLLRKGWKCDQRRRNRQTRKHQNFGKAHLLIPNQQC